MGGSSLEASAGICEVEHFAGPGARPDQPCDLLVEVPHGATRARHFEALCQRLRSPLPADLREFFFVNTDVGAPECAVLAARLFVDPAADPELSRRTAGTAAGGPRRAVVLRCLLPRTLCDCNRVVDPDAAGTMTPAIPSYVTLAEDRALLVELHRRYDETARQAYAQVCGSGGAAIALHTYAPRSVGIETIDGSIVEQLRAAYRPERYETWPRRPTVDLITASADGTVLAPRELVQAIRSEFERDGVQPAENATYHLHAATAGLLHSQRWPGQVLCIEFDRAVLADPFEPFSEMRIGASKVRRMVRPLVAALLRASATGPR